jgi:hypothetical protein
MDIHIILALFHIFIVAPLFFVIAFFREKMPDWAFTALLGTGIFIAVYHSYKYIIRLSQHSAYAWVNLIHVLFIAPLLIYIGYMHKQTPNATYDLAIMVGFAALGYHTYSLIKQIQVIKD